jgi:hypothetical protein
MIITLFVYLLCLACWLGGMVFFSIFMMPVVFKVLPISETGKLVSAVFPRYYLLGYVAGIISVILAIYFILVRGSRLWWTLAAVALVIALAFTFYAGAVVRPKADALRTVAAEQNPDPARKAEFDRLHRLSVKLNGAVMLLNLLALLSSAAALSANG